MTQDVEYRTGTVELTVDASKHVNGGCRSLNSAGMRRRPAAADRQELPSPLAKG